MVVRCACQGYIVHLGLLFTEVGLVKIPTRGSLLLGKTRKLRHRSGGVSWFALKNEGFGHS